MVGELQEIHRKFEELENRIESDFLAVRNHINKILMQIKEKEDELVDQLREMGIEKLIRHNYAIDDASLWDTLGLTFGDPSFNNLTVLEGAIEKGHENSEQLRAIWKKLHAFMGVQARYFEIKTDLRFEYCRKVAKQDPTALDELKQLVNHRDRYSASFSRYETEEPEYEAYINKLGEIYNTQIRKMIEDFNNFEKTRNERERVYHHYMADEQSEALDTFREQILQHLAGSIVVKEHRVRY